MDILKIFRMQEPISKDLLKNANREKLNKTSTEIVTAVPSTNKITALENQLEQLKKRNAILENELKQIEFQEIIQAYEEFIQKILNEITNLKEQKNIVQNHLANLEIGFSDLFEKYERAKQIVGGYKNNEEILKKEIKNYQIKIDQLNQKFNMLKQQTDSKLHEANAELIKKDDDNVQTVAKLKAKLLQSKAKISDLEKQVKFDKTESTASMFAPLQTNIIMTPRN